MKKLFAITSLLLAAVSASFGQSSLPVVHWRGIAGVITAQGVSNPISNRINSGTFAWTTRSGAATVDRRTGATAFYVNGLVINGAMFSGTPGPVPAVVGTLVCDAGTDRENAHDTPAVHLGSQGHAQFAGHINDIPASCGNPLFLLRIAHLSGANGRWIATGTERSFSY